MHGTATLATLQCILSPSGEIGCVYSIYRLCICICSDYNAINRVYEHIPVGTNMITLSRNNDSFAEVACNSRSRYTKLHSRYTKLHSLCYVGFGSFLSVIIELAYTLLISRCLWCCSVMRDLRAYLYCVCPVFVLFCSFVHSFVRSFKFQSLTPPVRFRSFTADRSVVGYLID